MRLNVSPEKIQSVIGFNDSSDIAIIFKDNPELFEVYWKDIVELYHHIKNKNPEEANRLEAEVIKNFWRKE